MIEQRARRATDGAAQAELSGGVVEYQVLAAAPGHEDEAPLVWLHEGLGSLGLWRGFPAELHRRCGRATLVWSRHGYGRSAVVTEPRAVRYMHDEALVVLPELLDHLAIVDPVLLGHSDGASIALIYSGAGAGPVSAVVAIAPHVMVDDRTLVGVDAASEQYRTTDLGDRLGRWHDDPDATFWGWHDIWRNPAFRYWNIEEYLGGIACPVLAIQAVDDQYGTLEQLDRIAAGVPHPITRVVLDEGGHSPHLVFPDRVADAVVSFLEDLSPLDGLLGGLSS